MEIFKEINELVQETIKNNKTFVTPTTSWKTSGIYMIYINTNYPDKLLPIYIGQSKNIQDRYKKHMESLLGLNRIYPDVYKDLFFGKRSSYYEGAFKTCKIHKYMVEKNASLEDFHMIVLETCDPSELIEKESYYIEKFYAPYFGFNQLNSLTYMYSSGMRFEPQPQPAQVERLMKILEQEMSLLPCFLEYGFTHFNLNHSFMSSLPESYAQVLSTPSNLLELNSQIKVFNQTYKDIWKNEEYRKLFEENNSYKMKIEPIKVQIDSIEQLVTSEIESYAITSIKKDISTRPYDLKLYFLTLAQGIRVSDIPVQVQKKWVKIFQNELKQYRLLQEETKYWEEQAQPIREGLEKLRLLYQKDRYHEIVPNVEYPPFALQDRIRAVEAYKDIEVKENHLYIDMVFASTGRRFDKEQVPYLISLGMRYYDDQLEEIEYRWYVKNKCTEYTKEGLVYVEEDYSKMFVMSNNHFRPYAYTKNNEEYLSSISVGSELKSGINDYTIQSHDLTPLREILEEIELYINDETTIIVLTSEGPQAYERALMCENVVANKLFQLLSEKRPKSKCIVIKPRNISINPRKKQEKTISKKIAVQNFTEEEIAAKKQLRDQEKMKKYIDRVREVTHGNIAVLAYQGSMKDASYRCLLCGYEWSLRSDRIFSRTYCSNCKKKQKK